MKYSKKIEILVNAMMETDSTREAVLKAQEQGVKMDCEEDQEAFIEAVERVMKIGRLIL